MIKIIVGRPSRRLGLATLALAACAGMTLAPASAQQGYPGSQYPGSQARNPACPQLEGQLAALDRGTLDPAQAEQSRRLDDAARRQQSDLDRLTAQARRVGCEGGGFFALFGGQPAQCAPLNGQIQQARANLDRTMNDLQRAQGNTGADREGQRRSIIGALAQNDCGPQYRTLANQGGGGFFDRLFGPGTIINPNPAPAAVSSDTYKTLCVRTCDGFYFPISYSALPGRFTDDARACQRLCPAAEVALYSHRSSGEDVAQAVSTSSGRLYTELPTAFAYRKQLNPSCSCKSAGQTWADALKQLDDQTVESGDIVVTEERAKQLSQPQVDAQGKPIRPPARAGATAPPPARANVTVPTADKSVDDTGKRRVRIVGPTFIPQ
jgi:Protein of unknown function (DUF2865)